MLLLSWEQVLFSVRVCTSLPGSLLVWLVISKNVYEQVPTSEVMSFHVAVGFLCACAGGSHITVIV